MQKKHQPGCPCCQGEGFDCPVIVTVLNCPPGGPSPFYPNADGTLVTVTDPLDNVVATGTTDQVGATDSVVVFDFPSSGTYTFTPTHPDYYTDEAEVDRTFVVDCEDISDPFPLEIVLGMRPDISRLIIQTRGGASVSVTTVADTYSDTATEDFDWDAADFPTYKMAVLEIPTPELDDALTAEISLAGYITYDNTISPTLGAPGVAPGGLDTTGCDYWIFVELEEEP